MYEIRRKIVGPSVVYCLTCFTIAQLLYFLMVAIYPVAFVCSVVERTRASRGREHETNSESV